MILSNSSNYHPQTKSVKVMFLQVSVCPQGRGAWSRGGLLLGVPGLGGYLVQGVPAPGGGGGAWSGGCLVCILLVWILVV